MANDKTANYRIGLLGCGGIAGAWIEAVEEHAQCRIVLAYDLTREAAERRAQEAGAQVAATVEELLENSEVDLVIIATPTPSHPELVTRAARAGKHIMCEKPMALDLRHCQQMIGACAESGVKLAIGHTLRFWGAFRTCRRLIAEGAIGAPVTGSIDRMGTGSLRRVEKQQGEGDDHWRTAVRNYGGMALEGFIHELDFTRALFGEVASVSCQIAGGREYSGLLSPQLLQALISFESGALVTARTGSTVALPTRGYWIGGTEGGLRFGEWGGPVEQFRHDLAEPESVPCKETSAYYLELCDLLEAIETGGEPENGPLNGKKNIALGLGMYWSFETGRRIDYKAGIPVDMADDYQNVRYY